MIGLPLFSLSLFSICQGNVPVCNIIILVVYALEFSNFVRYEYGLKRKNAMNALFLPFGIAVSAPIATRLVSIMQVIKHMLLQPLPFPLWR